VYGEENFFCTELNTYSSQGRTEISYQHNKHKEPNKEGHLSFVLLESPFTSVSTVMRGHPSLVISRYTNIYSICCHWYSKYLLTERSFASNVDYASIFLACQSPQTPYTIHIHLLLLLLIYVFYVTYTRTCMIIKSKNSHYLRVCYIFFGFCDKRHRLSLLTVTL
jgi:hypothetical protein